MRRNRKGTTRTGAIPTCMAEVSPARSYSMLWYRVIAAWKARARQDLEALMYGQATRPADEFDGVVLFAKSHPPMEKS